MSLYDTVRHPHLEARRALGPVRIIDQLPTEGPALTRFNTWLALKITAIVGSMWCAYAFAAFDLLSLPASIRAGTQSIVSWVAQTFLQLVLLSIIMVGQNVQGAAADKRSQATYDDAEAVLHTAQEIQNHLLAQDLALEALAEKLGVELRRVKATETAAGGQV